MRLIEVIDLTETLAYITCASYAASAGARSLGAGHPMIASHLARKPVFFSTTTT